MSAPLPPLSDKERERERERDRQTDRQTETERDRQTDRQTWIPYYYLIGVSKSGTNDFYHFIVQHPEAVGASKEMHWFDRYRYEGNQYNKGTPVRGGGGEGGGREGWGGGERERASVCLSVSLSLPD